MLFSVTNLTKRNLPIGKLRFSEIKETILGKDYDLSLVFIGSQRSKKLNKKYRNKDNETNILSFPINKDVGEIFLNLNKIKKETKKFEMDMKELSVFLFIHGCLHLKGFKHGKKMEERERWFLKKFL